MGPPLVTRQVSNLLEVHFIGDCLWKLNHAPKVGQLYQSSDVGFRVHLVPQSQMFETCENVNLKRRPARRLFTLINMPLQSLTDKARVSSQIKCIMRLSTVEWVTSLLT